ncbi:BCL2/adenovirus E1B 19 kDa protein-interacting protein, putative [Pediculus humanus corporis]|uniref:BCL2/adenovirus E1B 19 kDa protein-interacting protein, putative n=1 Tax=Pediculus humanus subsp. corporis TaxID=121224 RepID=E0VNJ9_PEDHC|nr:BCL2/adenovirus E1B 19 kDa protein-interacting protein, putative [Pediculus humanus corporis]EEB14955.1 BCL2/adenovirus E1B 19 kDa protein-interacting protein, putative [Pediculus humanus corporis]
MSASPKSNNKLTDEILGDSWVELNTTGNGSTPDRVTPLPFTSGEEYLRLLREAQRESNQSSARVSLASSRRDSPRDSPKSPPNSPNTELNTEDEFRGVYINYLCKDGVLNLDSNSDWIWDWSSRPEQAPPKDWKFKHPKRKTYSIRNAKVGRNSLFSKEVLYTLFITNFISLLLGTGVGLWLSRRGLIIPKINLE